MNEIETVAHFAEIVVRNNSLQEKIAELETEVTLLKRLIATGNARSFGRGHEASELQKDHESAKAELAKFYKGKEE